MTGSRMLWLVLGFAGAVLLVLFDAPVALTLGVLCLVGFVAWGVTLIATPAFTCEDEPPNPG